MSALLSRIELALNSLSTRDFWLACSVLPALLLLGGLYAHWSWMSALAASHEQVARLQQQRQTMVLPLRSRPVELPERQQAANALHLQQATLHQQLAALPAQRELHGQLDTWLAAAPAAQLLSLETQPVGQAEVANVPLQVTGVQLDLHSNWNGMLQLLSSASSQRPGWQWQALNFRIEAHPHARVQLNMNIISRVDRRSNTLAMVTGVHR